MPDRPLRPGSWLCLFCSGHTRMRARGGTVHSHYKCQVMYVSIGPQLGVWRHPSISFLQSRAKLLKVTELDKSHPWGEGCIDDTQGTYYVLTYIWNREGRRRTPAHPPPVMPSTHPSHHSPLLVTACAGDDDHPVYGLGCPQD